MLTFVAYIPAIAWGGFVWDDHPHVLTNKMLYQPDALRRIWLTLEFQQYYPLQLTTYWLELQLFGQNPQVMHFTNVALHALAGVLLWRVLRRLNMSFAWWAAAVFLLHPVNVETAAWITERRNVLCAVFYFATLLCWLRFEESRNWRWYAATLAAFFGAILSKTVACSIPVVILIISWARGQNFPGLLRDFARVSPMFVVGLCFGLLTAGMERYLIGANGYEWNFSIAERLLICGRALWFYASSVVAPYNLCFMYPRWQLDTSSIAQWSFFIAAVLFVFALIPIGRRFGRAAVAPLLCFGVMIFPALGFANIYPQRFSFVADHFQYLATSPLIVFLTGAAWHFGMRLNASAPIGTALGALLLCAFGAVSFLHSMNFQSDEVMWKAVFERNPQSWLAHKNMGTSLFNRGQRSEALEHYRKAMEHGPRPLDTRLGFQLGEALETTGDAGGAREMYTRAFAESCAFEIVASRNRELPLLGRVVRKLAGTPPDFLSIYEYQRVTATEDALLALAQLEKREGKRELAVKWIAQAEELRPTSYKPVMARGYLAAEAGENEKALGLFSLAAAKTTISGEPHVLCGKLLLQMGKIEEAHAAFVQALKREPRHAEAHLQLGVLEARAGNFPAAYEHLKDAVEADSALLDAHANLARVLLAMKRYEAAATSLQQAVQKARSADERQRLSDELAWVLATCPNERVRDPRSAMSYAEARVGRHLSIQGLDATAAAHADLGEFDKAVEIAEQARKAASDAGNAQLAANIAARIELYRQKKPYRQP
ncbi:MAG TPA: tetratricopeptide repeat protein [Planctomycetota bacterium]|nr:tetratricopeptide repeat protein [Planctomycetota bacterium]